MREDGGSSTRTVLIIGASGGLGRAVARVLKTAGYAVFGTSWTLDRSGSEAEVPLLSLDVRSEESVVALIADVVRRVGRLDVLVNNAAYRFHGAAEETSVEEARATLETNFLGVHRVTRAVLPILRRGGGGRIVNISSLTGVNPPPFAALYAASKAALAAYSESLWHEVRPFGIHVSVIEPGPMRTEPQVKPQPPNQPVAAYDEPRGRALGAILKDQETSGLRPSQVAACVARVVTSAAPKLRYRVGAQATWLPRLKTALPWSLYVKGVRRKYNLDE